MQVRNGILVMLLVIAVVGVAPAVTVDEIVAKYVEARGGAANLSALKSLRISGKLIFGAGGETTDTELVRVATRQGQMRSEVTIQGLTAVTAFDGTEGWSMEPFGGRREPRRASADEAKGMARAKEIDSPLIGWREKGHQLEYLDTEDIDGTPALKLRVQRKDGDTQYIYLDPDSYLDVRHTIVSRIRGTESESETDFGEYEQVAGVWFPLAIDSGAKGRPKTSHVKITRIEPNTEVDPALFRFPAAGEKVTRALFPGPAAPASGPAGEKPAPPPPQGSPVMDAGVVSGLGARNIGSATMSGRIAALAARNDGGKTTVYVGAASGGVWKSIDGGTTFKPVFDKQPVQSIGAITIDPSNPKTVWVGTGESWTRNSVSIGNGIYKSTDAGETWTHMGLPESERIVRIIVHPKNSDIVYACVPGKLWSDSPDRGLYKTTDGGKTWAQILKGPNLSTGCSSLTMDGANPNVLLAGMWDFRRKGWTFRSGGEGPNAPSGSGLFRSTDGGQNWTALDAKNNAGLPPVPWGRVEVVIAPSDSKIVYALIESTKSGLFRSTDGGTTWEARDRSQMMVWRPFYFARLIVDPTNPQRLFKPNLSLIVSEDGGKSFSSTGGGAHGDWHDLWIDPDNPKHVLGGDDGGFWLSYDGGNRWWKGNNLPVSQFYHVSVDNKDPYQVYGGLQDNSSFVGDSAYPGGITNARWESLYFGDGFYTLVDPSDPNFVYAESQGGFLGRVDRRTHAGRGIQPMPNYKEKLRFNWNTPVHISPTQKSVIYIGAQFLFRSRDHGDTWERISPDLTTNDPEKQKQEQSGGITVDNSSAETHTTIYTISESPKNPQVIWVGTDDGNLQLTRDGGKTWTNVAGNVTDLPKHAWVSWVEASRFDPATAYATFDRHTIGDMTPWIYRTRDFGKTWSRIAGPESGVRGYAHCIKEDVVKSTLLFAGTEFGLWISADAGKTWVAFKGRDFPAVAVREVQVHPREHDLILATHGRGIWIVDDLSPLRALSADATAKAASFLAGRPMQQRMPAIGGWSEGDASYIGENPPGDAVITYYLRARHMFGPIKLELFDEKGKLLDTIPATKRRGINRVVWSMRAKPPRVPRAAQVLFFASQGPRLPPGTYVVRLTRGADVAESKLQVGLDRRAPFGPNDRKANFDAAMSASALFGDMSALVDKIDTARRMAEETAKAAPPGAKEVAPGASAGAKAPASSGDAVAGKLHALIAKLEETKKKIVATKEGGDITGEERIREHLGTVYGTLIFWEGRPAPYQIARIAALRREFSDVAKEFDELVAKDLALINEALKQRNLKPISTTN